jgi:hypothetical protein
VDKHLIAGAFVDKNAALSDKLAALPGSYRSRVVLPDALGELELLLRRAAPPPLRFIDPLPPGSLPPDFPA